MSRTKPFVVLNAERRMFLGGRRSDGGPLWRLRPGDALRFATLADAEEAARWSGGVIEERS